ncbi:MAG: helix-turn-helix domain-containing protein [Trinickia sp.]|uniref:helix-turn-helix domain-containing protein n=1 Tax=Trinickia sp. TaxID=2571163 RepID=UPI003F7FA74A
MTPHAHDSLIDEILRRAAQKKLSQKDLASRAQLSEEALSRMKKRGSARLSAVERLAEAAGLRLALVPTPPSGLTNDAPPDQSAPTGEPKRFRDRHPELVWSNRDADDAIYIRRALVDPRFTTLLDAAREFGVDTLEHEWEVLMATPSPETRRAHQATTRILRNIRRGYEQATR